MNRSSYFIVGAETTEYLQKLMYEAELEAYKKAKRKKKHKKKYGTSNGNQVRYYDFDVPDLCSFLSENLK